MRSICLNMLTPSETPGKACRWGGERFVIRREKVAWTELRNVGLMLVSTATTTACARSSSPDRVVVRMLLVKTPGLA